MWHSMTWCLYRTRWVTN